MDSQDHSLPSFRAGDIQRRKVTRTDPGAVAGKEIERSYPFLEKLLESDEAAIEQFQQQCAGTCRQLDAAMVHASGPAATALGQSALSAYGHSLKLFASLLQAKYDQLRQQAESRQEVP